MSADGHRPAAPVELRVLEAAMAFGKACLDSSAPATHELDALKLAAHELADQRNSLVTESIIASIDGHVGTCEDADGEFNPDITPYDLAERLVAGREITETGKREIAAELRTILTLAMMMTAKINDGDCDTDDLIKFVETIVKRAGLDPRVQ